MAEQYFHLTIGPVQAFVAQARKTRDFWAGSFILSFLSSVAMSAVRQQGGKIQFPVPDDNYLAWLEDRAIDGATKPIQGSVPNRFKAMEAAVGTDFRPDLVVTAVQSAWQELAELVWESDLAPVVRDDDAQRTIWDRQINNFWEVSWCLTEDQGVSNLLDRRKNWRNHVPADEPRVKCSLMEGYQELSGAERPGRAVRDFWNDVRDASTSLARDLREDEHLCAIAFVKRRFAHYFGDFQMRVPTVTDGDNGGGGHGLILRGWDLPRTVPSIAYLAAAPWLATSIERSADRPEALESIKTLQRNLKQLDAPWEGRPLERIRNACVDAGIQKWSWSQVSGQYLFVPAVEELIKEARRGESLLREDVPHLQQVLKSLRDLKRQAELSEPSPFYAILLMDGDSLGVQMGDPAKQEGISLALNDFTRGVPDIVAEHSGFLVYAGGDDVLAILPQPDAMVCANALRQHYDECFARQADAAIFTSLSGAIEFSHYKTPLTQVLQDAHRLLDDIAKDKTGRNSLAVRVWKPGGLFAEWSAPWSVVPALQQVTKDVAENLQGDLSRSFFFKLETLIEQLQLEDGDHPYTTEQIGALVRAAWVHTGKRLNDLPQDMDQDLLEACRWVYRSVQANAQAEEHQSSRFMPGALRLVQFLATENRMLEAHAESVAEPGEPA